MFVALALLALPLVAAVPVGVFDPHHIKCLSPVYTGTPPFVKGTNEANVGGLMLDDADPSVSGSKAVLSPSGMRGRLDLSDGTVAAHIGQCVPYFLNIGDNEASYKPLSWSYERVDGIWEAAFTQPLKATASGSGDFLACRQNGTDTPNYALYLQTGSDAPADAECFTTQLVISDNTLHLVGSN